MKQVGGAEMWYSQESHPWVTDPQMGGNHNQRSSLQGAKGLNSTSRSPAQGAQMGKMRMPGFKNQWGLHLEDPKATGNRFLSERAHSKSHTL